MAVMGDDAALDARIGQMEAMAREGRYPSGSYLPSLARGFAAFERGDFAAAIDALAPLAGQNERIGGSRAQHDLIEFTLLKAYLDAGRPEEAQRLLGTRRPGASGVPVEGNDGRPLSLAANTFTSGCHAETSAGLILPASARRC